MSDKKPEYMLIQLKAPLFLLGTNCGDKVGPGVKGITKILWDAENRFMEVHSDKGFTQVPVEAISNMTPIQGPVTKIVNKHHDVVANVAARAQIGGPNDVFTAQVSTPQQQVKSRQAGKPPKYQGE